MFSSWVIFPFFTMLTSSEWSWLIFYMFAGLSSLLPTAKNYFPLLRLIIYMKLKIGWWITWLVFLFLLFLYLISKLLISFMFLTILYTRIWERNNNYILLYHFEPFRPTPNHSHGYQGGLLLNLEDIQPVLTLILTPFLKSETCFMHGVIVWQRIAFKLYHIGRHFLN